MAVLKVDESSCLWYPAVTARVVNLTETDWRESFLNLEEAYDLHTSSFNSL